MKYDLKNVTSISIERSDDNGTVTATAYGRDPYCPSHVAVIKRASAKCGPNDIFDFNIGAKLALDRLYEGYDMTPKPKRKPYNGLIYIKEYPGAALKNKSIYRVKGGVIQKCKFGVRPFIYEGMSDEELSAEIDDVVWGRNIFGSYSTPEDKYPLTVAHFIDNIYD